MFLASLTLLRRLKESNCKNKRRQVQMYCDHRKTDSSVLVFPFEKDSKRKEIDNAIPIQLFPSPDVSEKLQLLRGTLLFHNLWESVENRWDHYNIFACKSTSPEFLAYWKRWGIYGPRSRMNHYKPPMGKFLDFFSQLFNERCPCSVLISAKNAMAYILDTEYQNIFLHAAVTKLFKDTYNFRLHLLKMLFVCDVKIIFGHFKTLRIKKT